MGMWSRRMSLIFPPNEVPLHSGHPSRKPSVNDGPGPRHHHPAHRMSRVVPLVIDPDAVARGFAKAAPVAAAEDQLGGPEISIVIETLPTELPGGELANSSSLSDDSVGNDSDSGLSTYTPKRKMPIQLPPAVVVYGRDGQPCFRLSELEMRFRLADDDDDGYITPSDCAMSLKMAGLPVTVPDILGMVAKVPLGNSPLVDLVNYIQVYKLLEPCLASMAAA
eukprot:EG_transcript_8968